MNYFFLPQLDYASVFWCFLALYRVIFGSQACSIVWPAISAIGTKNPCIATHIWSFCINEWDMFIDISMVYALLNFIGCIAAAKYLESQDVNDMTLMILLSIICFAGRPLFLCDGYHRAYSGFPDFFHTTSCNGKGGTRWPCFFRFSVWAFL